MAKNFDNVNTARLYETIAEATAEQDAHETQITQDTQVIEPANDVKPAQAAQDRYYSISAEQYKTGRINMAFTPENYDFIHTMAKVRGQTMTNFVNEIIAEARENNGELYQRAIEFRNSMK